MSSGRPAYHGRPSFGTHLLHMGGLVALVAVGVLLAAPGPAVGLSTGPGPLPAVPHAPLKVSEAAKPRSSPPVWKQLLIGGPPARAMAASTYDYADGWVVVFGGCAESVPISLGACSSVLGDTWVFNGSWYQLTPTVAPTARWGAMMTYDPTVGEVLLFGGDGSSATPDSDLWSFKAGLWTEITPSATPGGWWIGSFSYDPWDGVDVLAGGQTSSVNYESNTWTYDAGTNSWTNVCMNCWGGTDRYLEGFTNDTAMGQMLLFGGGSNYAGGWAGDTWEYVGGTWTALSPTNGTGPAARAVGGMTYDPQLGVTVLYGGTHNDPVFNDTWEFTGTAWNNLSSSLHGSPTARYGPSFVYDPAGPYILMFGGADFHNVPNAQTWTFGIPAISPGVNGWTNVTSVAGAPPARVLAGMAYDAHDGYTVLFGGCGSDPTGLILGACADLLDDTWVYTGGLWRQLTPATSPSPRWGAAMTYDAALGELLLFGGDTSTGVAGDTWAFSAGSWTPLAPTTSPPARWLASMDYDAAHGEALLVGGETCTSNCYSKDTWVFTGASWSSVCTTCWGSAGYYSVSLDYDSAIGASIMFGGGCPTGFCNSAYTFTGSGWSTFTLGTPPAPRLGAGLAFDGVRGYSLLFGGMKNGPIYSDSWIVSPAGWANLSFAVYPSPRWGMGMVYDQTDHYILLFGGEGFAYATLGDTWIYGNYTTWSLNASAPALAPTDIDLGQSTSVTTTATGGAPPYSYSWNSLPPGCSGFGSTFSCTPSAKGNFSISATVTDSTGATVTSPTSLLVVNRDPFGTISAAPLSGAAPLTVAFTSAIFGGTSPIAESWNFGDGNYGTGPAPSHPYTGAGRFLVSFWANDSAGWVLPRFTNVTVSSPLTATLLPSSTNVSVGSDLWLNISASGGSGALSYAWTSVVPGCPSGATSASLLCVPTTVGMYLVSGTVSDALGHTATFAAHVGVYDPLVATLKASVSPAASGATVYFNGSATGGVGALSYAFPAAYAGCSSGSSQGREVCSTTTAGNYTVVLEAVDALGHIAFAAASEEVLPAAAALTLVLHATPSNVSLGAPVYVNATASGGIGPYTVSWTALPNGCPTSPSGTDIVCSFFTAGSNTMSALVVDSKGVFASASTRVTVYAPPQVVLAVSAMNISLGASTFLNATGSGGYGGLSYSWSGLPSGCVAPAPTEEACVPTGAGTYRVVVTVVDRLGDSASASTTITVTAPSSGAGLLSGAGLIFLALSVVLGILVVVLLVLLLAARRKKEEASFEPPALPYDVPVDNSHISPIPTSTAPHEDPVPPPPMVRSASAGPPPASRPVVAPPTALPGPDASPPSDPGLTPVEGPGLPPVARPGPPTPKGEDDARSGGSTGST